MEMEMEMEMSTPAPSENLHSHDNKLSLIFFAGEADEQQRQQKQLWVHWVLSGSLGYSRVLSGTWVTTPHVCLSLCCICQLATALASTRQRPQTRLAFHNIFISI